MRLCRAALAASGSMWPNLVQATAARAGQESQKESVRGGVAACGQVTGTPKAEVAGSAVVAQLQPRCKVPAVLRGGLDGWPLAALGGTVSVSVCVRVQSGRRGASVIDSRPTKPMWLHSRSPRTVFGCRLLPCLLGIGLSENDGRSQRREGMGILVIPNHAHSTIRLT